MKKFISGLIVGMLIMGTVFAGGITASFVDFNFKINGEAVKMENSPLTYGGKSYLPVRELAGLLGYEVNYDDRTNTIELDSKISPTNQGVFDKATKPLKEGVFSINKEIVIDGIKVKLNSLLYTKEYNNNIASDYLYFVLDYAIFIDENSKINHNVYDLDNSTSVRIFYNENKMSRGSNNILLPHLTAKWSIYESVGNTMINGVVESITVEINQKSETIYID